MSTSTFNQNTVLPEISIAKMSKDAPLSKASAMGGAVPTGISAVRNTAKVEPGSAVAVFGLGAVGMAVIQGAVLKGASRIIGIDVNSNKFPLANALGATECVNPKDHSAPIHEVLIEMTNGGLEHTFEAVGDVDLIRSALEACHKGWDEFTVIGVAGAGQVISTRPFQLVTDRVWHGTAFGGVLGRNQLPSMVDEWLRGDFDVESYITHHVHHEQLNTAFVLLKAGEAIRSVIHFKPDETMTVNSLPRKIVPV